LENERGKPGGLPRARVKLDGPKKTTKDRKKGSLDTVKRKPRGEKVKKQFNQEAIEFGQLRNENLAEGDSLSTQRTLEIEFLYGEKGLRALGSRGLQSVLGGGRKKGGISQGAKLKKNFRVEFGFRKIGIYRKAQSPSECILNFLTVGRGSCEANLSRRNKKKDLKETSGGKGNRKRDHKQVNNVLLGLYQRNPLSLGSMREGRKERHP